MNDISFRAHQVAMSIHSLRMAVDDLTSLVSHIGEQDHGELDIARFDLEQLLMKLRHPILQRQPAA